MTQQKVRIQKRLENKDKTIWGISIILVLGPISIKFLNDFVSNQSKEIFKWELTKIDYAGNLVSAFPFLKGYDVGLLLSVNKYLNVLLIIVLVIFCISIVKAILEFLLYIKFKSDDKDLYIEKKEDTENINLIHSDKPLNYTTFKEKFLNEDGDGEKSENSESKTIPETIFNNFKNLIKEDSEPQVISLTASWGAGKTSFF
ncbi:MAG: P-loop NTPase fold protein [bacterium]